MQTEDTITTDDLPQLDELVADRASWEGEASSLDQDAMFADLAALTTDKKPSVLDHLREMSTPMRVLVATFAMIGAAGIGVMMGIRPDIASGDAVRFAVIIASLMGMVAVVCAVSLRGYDKKPLGPLAWGIIGVSLGLPAVLALFPELWTTGAALTSPPAQNCLAFGTVNGAMSAGIVWLFQRGRPTSWRLGAAAAAGGLTAFAALQMHCPSQDVGHMLIGHAAVGFVLAAAALLYAATRRSST